MADSGPTAAPSASPRMEETTADAVSRLVFGASAPRPWYAAVSIAVLLVVLLLASVAYLLVAGVGIWGISAPVGWGFAIVNFVWWIGIAHAGTLISAILLLLRQGWRTEVNRFAETMTVFAIFCAALFPLIHLGRPWLAYWMFPYPNSMGAWPQFQSPLVWDVFAIATYAIVSLLFWYVGLIPDFAVLRDRAANRRMGLFYGALAFGWRGAASHWRAYQQSYRLLAGLATVLVISVHTVVSFDFAVSLLPGWHSTIFPPYFVAGAIFSGFAMLLTLLIPVRAVYRLEDVITRRHLDAMGKILLATGLMVAYAYGTELFAAAYSGNTFEKFVAHSRLGGADAPAFWIVLLCNVVVPQLLWSMRVRRSPAALFAIALAVDFGMWLERYVIVVSSLQRDFLPSSWREFAATPWDWATLAGSVGVFLVCLLWFLRRLPIVSLSEVGLAQLGGGGREAPASQTDRDRGPDMPSDHLYGVLAEFRSPKALAGALRHVRAAGYRHVEAYSPVPLRELQPRSAPGRRGPARAAFAGGVVGGAGAVLLQYWVVLTGVPSNIGARPLNSWPAFVPITFECAILGAALAVVIWLFLRTGLPCPYHPLFSARRFSLGYGDRLFLCVKAGDAGFDSRRVADSLASLNPVEVTAVEP